MKVRILAFYLPQFHRVPENDEWWGEGYTDWTAVRSAEPLFEGHKQPRVPLNGNYYNLLEHDTMAWQADLMNRYQIDGMCIYHYWFGRNKRILEKPAENLLSWKDIQMPFCFCWANETWSKTWKKFMYTNVWTAKGTTTTTIENNDILLKQIYGRESDWEEHIQYLLKFFQDERYIQLDGKPVLVILKTSHIFQLWEMLQYFDKRVMENGFPGIYVIGMEEDWQDGIHATCIRQPRSAMAEYRKQYNYKPQGLQVYPYDELCQIQMETKIKGRKTYLSCAVDHDSTPRMGQIGIVIRDASPEKFYTCFKTLYQKSILLENEFLFINAWNEWGEGMYLEPDEKVGYEYLESISRIVREYKDGMELNECKKIEMLYKIEKEEYMRIQEQVKVLERHDQLLDRWMQLRDKCIDFSSYFIAYGYKNIAVYGVGRLGIHLQQELNQSNICVCFGIDKCGQNCSDTMKVYTPFEPLPEVDAVVITILGKYKEISELLKVHMNCPMVTLEEIIQELLFE